MTTSESRAATFAELGLRCETCGAPATCMVQDFIRKYSDRSPFVEHERDGDAHFFCAMHERPSRMREKI